VGFFKQLIVLGGKEYTCMNEACPYQSIFQKWRKL